MANYPPEWKHFTEQEQGMDAESIKWSIARHIEYTQAKDEYSATQLDFFESLARAVRDRLLDRWNRTQQKFYHRDVKRVYYLSLEYLLGRLLRDALNNLNILDETKQALKELRIDFDQTLEQERDAGLGNGGLGRLAACFLDSMATLGLPVCGCGLRYEFGMFRQLFIDGEQAEVPDNWLHYGNPWEIPRPEVLYPVRFGGQVLSHRDQEGHLRFDWVDTRTVLAMAYDTPVPGFCNETVNTLRLWGARASQELNLQDFNRGDYLAAVQESNESQNLTRVLYPDDSVSQGKELRLKQEYFLVSATLQDALRRHLKVHPSLETLHEKVVFQLNDTHPSLAVPELMRLLVDEHGLAWEPAWTVARQCFAYTNHTVMPEALEQWPVPLLERVLPRHLQIIYEINARFLQEVRTRWPHLPQRLGRMSLIAEGGVKQVRMAHLAIVGSFSVNGVSELHTQLVRERLFSDFAELWPEKFNNKTNGITPRRWLLGCNRDLASLISSRIEDDWPRNLNQLERLKPLATDPAFQEQWLSVKKRNKERLAALVQQELGQALDPESLFDVQVKRIHEYKRQLLNTLHALSYYRRLKAGELGDQPARTIIFSGKAAPGYAMAKLIISFINNVAELINGDKATRDQLRLVFLPNYSVSLAELIIPAADLSEQISLAGTEASGTGNMKLALNGALTLGTLDGANIEIREAVGDENIFIFGLDKQGVDRLREQGYRPQSFVETDPDLRLALELVASKALSPSDPQRYRPIVDRLLKEGDPFLVLADFASYRETQQRVGRLFHDRKGWARRSILNVSQMGRFSSDVTVERYAREIWDQNLPTSDSRPR